MPIISWSSEMDGSNNAATTPDPVGEVTSSVVTLVSSTGPLGDGDQAKTTQNNRKSYLVIVGAIVCAVGFIIATGLLADQASRSGRQLDAVRKELREKKDAELADQRDPVCNTRECVVSAGALLEAMDQTVDPCEDFFQFACGGWIKKNGIPNGRQGVSGFGLLNDQIHYFIRDFLKENNTMEDSKAVNSTRDLYAACTNMNAIEDVGLSPLIQLLNSYGRWPMTVTNWTEDKFDWKKTSAYIRNTLGGNYLIDVSNFIDTNNTERSIIYIDQPNLGVSRAIFANANASTLSDNMFLSAYATFVASVAAAVRDEMKSSTPNAAIIYDVQEMILFEMQLEKILKPDWNRTWEFDTYYFPYSLPALQNLTDGANVTAESHAHINWHEFLNDIYSLANVSIKEDERVIVIEADYLRQLVQLLDRTSPRVIANYLHWRVVLDNIKHLNVKLNVMAGEFMKALIGFNFQSPRWHWCMTQVDGLMGYAIGSKYIEKAFDPNAKLDMLEMIDHLKIAFSALVEENDWMDHETKIKALEKAKAMREFIGYPDWIANRTTLEIAYRGMKPRIDRHFENFRSANQFIIQTNLKFLRFRTDRNNLWISFPVVVNAFYFPLMNSITFPAGILQPPFYGKGRLAALNYGAIGAVIGHEISHGFDHHGHKTDKDGHKISWWTNATLNEFFNRTKCFVEQYNNYTIPELEGTDAFRVNGTFTQGENIADNGGLREAYRAYENYIALNGREPKLPGLERFSSEQLFFISFANTWCGQKTKEGLKNQILSDPHSPSRFRTIGALSNSEEFAHHFQCPAGPMNRPNKCILW